jgi:aldehyde dehydrogenase (NAD+)
MEDTSQEQLQSIYNSQKAFFAKHKTKDLDFRIRQLKKLKSVIEKYKSEIEHALWIDLRKSPEEVYLTEISIVLSEIKEHISNLKQWAQPKKVQTPIHLLPSSSKIVSEPLGLSLIISPWNYPFQLIMNPLVGAISSGCCSILKSSPDAPSIAKLMEKMIHETFAPEYITLVQGGRETNTSLLQKRFDIIFFTGSSRVGKVVMKAAAEYLTPVVLELGGKSPCIVDKDADLNCAARRIIWGKLINAGQTCIAPDYVFAHVSIKEKLMEKMVFQIRDMLGSDCKTSRFYPRIVNEKAMIRLESLMNEGKIYFGGEIDKTERYISPTIIDEVKPDFKIMQEEIFGPILPIMTFEKIEETLEYINSQEKPLAFYYFGKRKNTDFVIENSTSGGACINDTIMSIANHNLPFGGVGNSGMGRYHGKQSFLAFSNSRSIVVSPTWIDLPFKYAPYKWFKLIKKII